MILMEFLKNAFISIRWTLLASTNGVYYREVSLYFHLNETSNYNNTLD